MRRPHDVPLSGPVLDIPGRIGRLAANANVPPHVLSALLGHAPGRIMGISAVYIRHRYVRERRVVLENWGDYVSGLVSPEKAATGA